MKFLCVTALLLALSVAAGIDEAVAAGKEVVVTISNFTFDPPELTVAAGTTVVFRNDDDIPHLVIANDSSFKSKALDTGETYSLSLDKPGTYAYFCGLHPHMQGKIVATKG